MSLQLRRWISGVRTVLAVGLTLALPAASRAAALVRLPGHVPAVAAASRLLGPVTHTYAMPLAIVLPLRNPDQLKDLIRRQYDPKDALFGRYLTPAEFADRFGATQADYDAVIAFVKSRGLSVTGTHANRLLVDVSGTPAAVEAALGVRLNDYRSADGAVFFAPDRDPVLPAALAGKIKSISGLSSAARPHPLMRTSNLRPLPLGAVSAGGVSNATPAGEPVEGVDYFLPGDIRKAYDLNDAFTGSGETVALFEIDGYYDYDVAAFKTAFGLPNIPVEKVLVDGFDGVPNAADGNYYAEIALDIDSVLTTALGAKKILVYEAPPGNGTVAGFAPGFLDELSKIASDDRANQVSVSYGLAEDTWILAEGIDFITNEDMFFQEMAAQGQSVYASSGDNGAYSDAGELSSTPTLSVLSPASDPYVTAVGGTSLETDAHGDYASESTWNDLATEGGGGGGGISTVWATPPWQTPFIDTANGGSTEARNLPDISLVADPLTGFVIYLSQGLPTPDGFSGPGFYVVGGTSLASPLWAGFNATVNQARHDAGLAPLGLAAPSLYGIAASAAAAADFHDIADGSTNGDTALYPGLPGFAAVPGYDLATGFGSYNAANLVQDLSVTPAVTAPPLDPQNVTAGAGDGSVTLSWSKSVGATGYVVFRATDPQGPFSPLLSTKKRSVEDTAVTNGTAYYYFVLAVGTGGESSGELAREVAATPAEVALTLVPLALVSPGKVTVEWQTNVLSSSTVNYGSVARDSASASKTDGGLTTLHSVTLTGLTAGQEYRYRAVSSDGTRQVHSGILHFVAQ